jgi:hypothetical protein
MTIEQKQKMILNSIKQEYLDQKNGYSPQKMSEYVWFYPHKGFFMYNDFAIEYDVIYPLIANGILIFNNFELHQGINMLSYKIQKPKSNI